MGFFGGNVGFFGAGGFGSNGAAAATPLLDDYGADISAAYDFDLLKTGETECITVREDGGDTEAVIGFSDGVLDVAAIASHCGANNGYISKWFDQSGNNYDAVQTTLTSQPQIYNGSAVLLENGKPCATYAAGDLMEVNPFTSPPTQPVTMFAIGRHNPVGNYKYLCSFGSSFIPGGYMDTTNFAIYAGAQLDAVARDAVQNLHTVLVNSTSSVYRINGSEKATGNAGATEPAPRFTLGGYNAVSSFVGTIQSVVIYAADKTADFANIEANLNASYGVYA